MTDTLVFALTGWPLGHSLSPVLHQAALAALGLKGEYRLMPVPPADSTALAALLQQVRNGQLQGLNVTIPHKQAVLPLLDELSPTARAIGAVNTLWMREGRLVGENTDAPGFLADLYARLGDHLADKARERCAWLLGAGGSARAVAFALASEGWRVVIAARRLEQAEALALSLGYWLKAEQFIPLSLAALPEGGVPHPQLIINATPLGMTPQVETSPWPEGLAFPSGACVYDLVYNPPETRLVREARRAGLEAVTGLGMLVEQAALALEKWTGLPVPREAMFRAVERDRKNPE
ncbi:shikimate dehydrogenase [Anaerolinea thermolimosa]|uniref:shikimate dehydrogenase n=1 Tax=Anaerolinea thermolimosa TaxID=229919 RepID=UPI0007853B7A|nr:shikimate dehydrogenase [Anaerolinea thermolimosa]GAP08023.1 shikimate dehydrogenase [Anaerolinea thermolimosa]